MNENSLSPQENALGKIPVAIALGSNLGDSQAILTSALNIIATTCGISLQKASSWYQTAPVGPPQPDYINGCAILETSLNPLELLEILLIIEAHFGRIRTEPNGPRTLDLDILLFDDLILESLKLQIPHPRMSIIAFAFVPLAEIATN